MKTVPFLTLVIAAVAALPASAAKFSILETKKLASDRVGNGGFAHVCRDTGGKIVSAKLLDLWEAESLKPHASEKSVEEQVEAALKKLQSFSPNSYKVVGYRYDLIKNAVVKVARPLSTTEDAFPPYEPMPGCRYEQVARFEPVLTETGTAGLRINAEIYDHPTFTNSDRAALFVHEAIYLVDRLRNQATNSQRSRTLTGHLMSESVVPNAVRMLFNFLINTDAPDEEGGKPNPIYALADPTKIKTKLVRIYEIEGVSYDFIEGEQGELQYRCMVGTFLARKTDRNGDTGYRPLRELVSYEKYIDLESVVGVHEFETWSREDERENDYRTMNDVGAQCYKKTADGKEVPVPFTGVIALEGAECMTISKDGSTFVSRGERCEIQIESTAEFIAKYPTLIASQPIGVVRAVPAQR